MKKYSTLHLSSETMMFSAGHFTVFSATERENYHGHNYTLELRLTVEVGPNGANFDCNHYIQRLSHYCSALNLHFLIPAQSPFLQIKHEEPYCVITFNQEKLLFLPRDIKLLPLNNISLESLSKWFLEQLLATPQDLKRHAVVGIEVRISSFPGRAASSYWGITEA